MMLRSILIGDSMLLRPGRELEEVIVRHFRESDQYRTRKGLVHEEEDSEILGFIVNRAIPGEIVLEVGGGSGAFLDLILNSTSVRDACNVELVADTYRNQVNGSISLVRGTALSLPFRDGSCDWVIAKNLLHHLVANTRRRSVSNASLALSEIARVTKCGGYVIIVEQYNRIWICCTALFYLTLLLSKTGFRSRYFGWDTDALVSFLTPREIGTMVRANIGKDERLFSSNCLAVPLRFKLSFLMSCIGRALVIVRRDDRE